MIAFIVPRTFCKNSIIKKLNSNFFMIKEYELNDDKFLFKKEQRSVPCVFQVWIHNRANKILLLNPIATTINGKREIIVKKNISKDFTFCNRTHNPDFAIRRVGVAAGKIFSEDYLERSDQSHMFIKINPSLDKRKILEIFNQLDLEKNKIKFNTAGNPSLSKNDIIQIYNEFINKKNDNSASNQQQIITDINKEKNKQEQSLFSKPTYSLKKLFSK